MYKRHITIVLCLILFLGLFFQYNRSDGFIRLIRNSNAIAVSASPKDYDDAGKNLPAERFLVVYDPENVYSLLLRRNIEKTARYLKKDVTAIAAKESAGRNLNYDGVILALENLDQVQSMNDFREYARRGGTVYLMFRPLPGAVLNGIYRDLGFSRIEGVVNTYGVKMDTNLLIGGKGFELDDDTYNTSTMKGELDPKARLHMSSAEGLPLLWEYDCGQGKYVVYNGSGLSDKINRGVVTAMLGLGKAAYVYPVVGMKMVFIDDFPAPIPEGNHEKIDREFQLSIPQFYRQIWWPDMLGTAEKYNVRYTGMIIETYNDQVRPPFLSENDPVAKTNLIVYGRELLKSGGELGLHGYNHQPLAPEGYKQQELAYNSWNSRQDMALSLTELQRYAKDVYPDYEFQVYVPPSNILSPEGRQALLQAFPRLKVIASLYNAGIEENTAYIQDFGKGPDGVFEIPRVSSDYIRSGESDWAILNVINAMGVFTHFVHPDEIFYPESAEQSWHEMHDNLESLLKEIQDEYGWLRSCTASRGADYLDDYLNLNYRLVEDKDKLTLYCWGFKEEVYFILKTSNHIAEWSGCQVERIDENTYLLKIAEPEVHLQFESGVKQ